MSARKRGAEIAKATGRRVAALVADVTKSDEVERAVRQILADFGQLDILVNNLGDSMRKPFAQVTDDELKFVMDVNFTATVLCARAVAPHMLGRRAGKVVNIGSFASLRGAVSLTIYSAAKSALVGLTHALALEWAPYGVQVNTIAPGLFPDAVTIGEPAYAERLESAKKRVPLQRAGKLREVGLLALYLDGGLTL